eukprot:scaffold112346_cov34-Prasinocladus_malaysianus.AAC.1
MGYCANPPDDTLIAPAAYAPTGHSSWVLDVAFIPDGAWLASASFDQTVMLWPDVPRETSIAAMTEMEDYNGYECTERLSSSRARRP